jgi:ribonuclease Z
MLGDVAQVVPGQKFAYVVDARYHPANTARIEGLVSGADVLFIECAFLHSDAAHAARKNHLTARQAGTLARRAGVKRLEPCHFSTRYADHGALLSEEAQAAFRGPAGPVGSDER